MELFKKMYEPTVHPRNLWLNQDPLQHEEVDQIYRENIQRLVDRGSWTLPADTFKGAHFQSGASCEEEAVWENVKQLWSDE